MEFYCDKDRPVVATNHGKIRGYFYQGVYHFKGISYAKAERFCPPEDVEDWKGVKDALNYGNVCPLMYPECGDGDFMAPHRVWFQDENCQNLNLWTPALEPHKKLPVLVWLHGGGFFAGSAIEQYAYDGYNMSYFGNVVVVTVNHRLNVLGYMDLREFGGKFERSVNVGNLDLIAALKWIRINIEKFGGNPDNVTIFGQSGGGAKVITLMQMPAADGLFHQAVIMSGTLGDFLTDSGKNMCPVVQKMLSNMAICQNDMEKLQKVPYAQLAANYLEAYNEIWGGKGVPYFAPVTNRDYIGDPMKVGFSENAKKIPVMIGSVFSEFCQSPYKDKHISDQEAQTILMRHYGTKTAENLMKEFIRSYPERPLHDIFILDSRAFRYWTKKWVEKRMAERAAATFSYLFTMEFPFNGGTSAWHCADIPFFFHNIDKVPVVNVDGISQQLQKKMFNALMNFVRFRTPSCEGLEMWTECKPGDEVTMLFDKNCEARHNFDTKLIELHYSLKVAPTLFD